MTVNDRGLRADDLRPPAGAVRGQVAVLWSSRLEAHSRGRVKISTARLAAKFPPIAADRLLLFARGIFVNKLGFCKAA